MSEDRMAVAPTGPETVRGSHAPGGGSMTSGGQTSAQRTEARGGSGRAPLLEVTDLVKHFDIRGGLLGISKLGAVRAVDGVSFSVKEGETLGLVGESGCGKTTLGKVILRLLPPTSGEVSFEGKSLFQLGSRELKAARRDIQVVFQDPYASLNPRMSVGETPRTPTRCRSLSACTSSEASPARGSTTCWCAASSSPSASPPARSNTSS